MSNKKKFEKNITKKLEKMYAAAKKNPSAESRLLFVSGKYGFSVIRMEEIPGSGRSFVDSAEFVMNKTVAKALSTSNMYISQNIGSIKARMYDGQSLANSFDAKRDVIGSSVDYAKIQGIDLDEASDRQRDNYVDHPDERKDTFMRVDGTNIPLKVNNIFEKVVADKKKLEQELNEAHDKAAEDYKKIEKLEKKVVDMTKTIYQLNAKNVALQKDMDGTMTKLNSIKEERDRLQKFYDDAKSKDTDADASDNDVAEELETVSDVLCDEAAVEALAKDSNTTINTKEDKTDYKFMVNGTFKSPVHRDEFSDDYMMLLLRDVKKPYDLRTIFKLQTSIYEEIEPNVYDALIGISDPRTINIRKFSRTAYAAAIALSVPESCVVSFMKRLIDDYKCGNFIPTDPKYVPKDFPKFLKTLYPDIDRIHRLLHTNIQLLPYVYKKENEGVIEYFTIGTRPYDNPSEIIDADYYIAIPKDANPYDFLEYNKTKELIMIFDCFSHSNRRVPIQHIMNDVDSSVFRDEYDKISTMRDQINRYIAADEAGLISIDCNNPDEILKNGLWFYPVVLAYSTKKLPVKSVSTKSTDEISSEPKQDSNEK